MARYFVHPTDITIAHASTPAWLEQTRVKGPWNASAARAFADGEGVWWIRGHYDESTPEGGALLASYALSRSIAA